jgi:ribonuclease P protein component
VTRIAPLNSSRDFRRVMTTGKRVWTPYGTLFVERSPGSTQLGLAVPRSAGGAVRRNRIKRRLRAAFRAAGLHDVRLVVRAGAGAERVPFQEMAESLRAASA